MHYRVFVASPSGLEEERKAFRDVLEKYNIRDGSLRGINFDPVGWEMTLGKQGRPQALINEEVRSCDFFLLLLHDRWGSPPGDAPRRFTSGTEEELAVARECLSNDALPMQQIVIMFKLVSERQLADPGPELSKVLEFRKKLEGEKSYLYQTFDELAVFKENVDRHVAQWVRLHEANDSSPNGAVVRREASLITRPADLAEDNASQRQTIRDQILGAEALYNGGKIVEAELAFSAVIVRFDDAWALARFGRFLRKTGNRHRATEMLTKALELAKMTSDHETEAYITRQLGQVRERSGDTTAAVAQYGHALQTYQHIGNAEGQARTHRDLALAHRKLGDYRRALEHLEKSKDIYIQLGNEDGIAATLGYQGVLYKSQGDLLSARAAHSTAIEIHDKRGDRRGLAAAKSNLGIVHRMLDEFDTARVLHEEALTTYEQLHDRQGQSREFSNLGTLERALGRHESAIDLHLKALAISEQLQNKQGIAIQFGNLGRDYYELGRFNEAEKLHVDSLNLSKSFEDVEGQAWQYEGMGNIERKRGKLAAAERRFEQAYRLFVDIGAKHGQAICAKSFGEVLLATGRNAEGKSYLIVARDIYRDQRLNRQADEIDALLTPTGEKA